MIPGIQDAVEILAIADPTTLVDMMTHSRGDEIVAKSIPDFAGLFPEVYEYLQMTLNNLNVNFRNELKGLT